MRSTKTDCVTITAYSAMSGRGSVRHLLAYTQHISLSDEVSVSTHPVPATYDEN